nr:MAG TPA: hypothetical protein [Caudoviricetes sp.]
MQRYALFQHAQNFSRIFSQIIAFFFAFSFWCTFTSFVLQSRVLQNAPLTRNI